MVLFKLYLISYVLLKINKGGNHHQIGGEKKIKSKKYIFIIHLFKYYIIYIYIQIKKSSLLSDKNDWWTGHKYKGNDYSILDIETNDDKNKNKSKHSFEPFDDVVILDFLFP